MLYLAGNPAQRIVTDFAAKFEGLVADAHASSPGYAPAAAKAIDDFTYGRGNCVTDSIASAAGPRYAPNPCSDSPRRWSGSLLGVLELRQHFEHFLCAARQHDLVIDELQAVVRNDNQASAQAQEATDR